ncbi:MAG: hypothetical protein GSR79_09595 [Desulfurococcales archaeon]|nr:hypothetical protein [Desulfurococcales archaeon]
MTQRLRLAGLFVFFLLIPPIGYGIVSSKTAALDSVSLDRIYFKNGEYHFNYTIKIDNPSLLPLKLHVKFKGITVNDVSLKITSVSLSKTIVPGRNKTLVKITVSGIPLENLSSKGYTLVKAGSDVCIGFSVEPSFHGFPGSVQCSYAETSSVIEIGS